jgi:hypothetical protein
MAILQLSRDGAGGAQSTTPSDLPGRRSFRHWFSPPPPPSAADRRQYTLTVLTGARSVLARGWVQRCWYVLEGADGRRHFVVPGSLAPRSTGLVIQACLVGAVVEAGRSHARDSDAVGPAIDALWCAARKAEGKRPDPARGVPSRASRRMQVRELTRWNDHRDRTQDDVLDLVDLAVERSRGRVAP